MCLDWFCHPTSKNFATALYVDGIRISSFQLRMSKFFVAYASKVLVCYRGQKPVLLML